MSKEKASERIIARSSKTGKVKHFSPVVVIIPSVVIIAVIVVLIVILTGKDSKSNLVVTKDNVKDIVASLDDSERTPIGSYETLMNTTWHFKNASEASYDAYISNSVNNRNTVYFTITLEGSNDVIYTSPYIPIGGSLENITFEEKLSAGTYNAVLKYYLVDDSYEEVSNVSVALTLIIEK